jgi:hypothetical protein
MAKKPLSGWLRLWVLGTVLWSGYTLWLFNWTVGNPGPFYIVWPLWTLAPALAVLLLGYGVRWVVHGFRASAP